MATLSKHGHEVERVDCLTCRYSYRSDGHILKNDGFGWKLYRKLKAGIDPVDRFKGAKDRYLAKLDPESKRYLECLHSMGGVSAWWKIHTCVEMMPDDPDGVWSMLDDMTGETNVTIEDCIELCHAYKRIKQ